MKLSNLRRFFGASLPSLTPAVAYARADDIAQETFIKVYRSIESFRGQSSFRTWLYRIAYNAFVDNERRNFAGEEFNEAEHLSEADFAPRADTARDVQSALRLLSTRQQAIFDLHYKKGMTHSEIAETLEAPIGTVKSDLRRGHERLRELLQARGFDDDE